MRLVDASDGGEADQGQIRHPAGDKLGWPSAGTARHHTAKAVIPGAGTRSVAGQKMALARRRRRGTEIDAASTTWLLIRFASSSRCTQKPSSPASWITTISTGTPATDSALTRMRASRPNNPAPSPAEIECFDIVTLPGDSEVTSHDVWLNSSDAKSVAVWCSTSVNSFIGRGIGSLHA